METIYVLYLVVNSITSGFIKEGVLDGYFWVLEYQKGR